MAKEIPVVKEAETEDWLEEYEGQLANRRFSDGR